MMKTIKILTAIPLLVSTLAHADADSDPQQSSSSTRHLLVTITINRPQDADQPLVLERLSTVMNQKKADAPTTPVGPPDNVNW